MSKYHNTKTTISGHTFDSRHEAERYIVLRSMEKSGLISDLRFKKKLMADRYGILIQEV